MKISDPEHVKLMCGCLVAFGGKITKEPTLMSSGIVRVEWIPNENNGVIYQPCPDHRSES